MFEIDFFVWAFDDRWWYWDARLKVDMYTSYFCRNEICSAYGTISSGEGVEARPFRGSPSAGEGCVGC